MLELHKVELFLTRKKNRPDPGFRPLQIGVSRSSREGNTN
jgi:hypothetical protein